MNIRPTENMINVGNANKFASLSPVQTKSDPILDISCFIDKGPNCVYDDNCCTFSYTMLLTEENSARIMDPERGSNMTLNCTRAQDKPQQTMTMVIITFLFPNHRCRIVHGL